MDDGALIDLWVEIEHDTGNRRTVALAWDPDTVQARLAPDRHENLQIVRSRFSRDELAAVMRVVIHDEDEVVAFGHNLRPGVQLAVAVTLTRLSPATADLLSPYPLELIDLSVLVRPVETPAHGGNN